MCKYYSKRYRKGRCYKQEGQPYVDCKGRLNPWDCTYKNLKEVINETEDEFRQRQLIDFAEYVAYLEMLEEISHINDGKDNKDGEM